MNLDLAMLSISQQLDYFTIQFENNQPELIS